MANIKVKIKGRTGLIMHSLAAGLDTRSALSLQIAEIAKKKGANRTTADDERLAFLECKRSLWLDAGGEIAIPNGAIRAMIEGAARKLKQGPQVREGMVVDTVEPLIYDKDRYGTTEAEWGTTMQFQVPVRVQQKAVMRTRALVEDWECVFVLDTDPELIDVTHLGNWLDIGGRRIGLGDWRPQKSGTHGRFETVSIDKV